MEKHPYPSSYPADSPIWSVRLSWALLDQIEPGVIPRLKRFLLGGLIAGALHEAYMIGKENRDPSTHGGLK